MDKVIWKNVALLNVHNILLLTTSCIYYRVLLWFYFCHGHWSMWSGYFFVKHCSYKSTFSLKYSIIIKFKYILIYLQKPRNPVGIPVPRSGRVRKNKNTPRRGSGRGRVMSINSGIGVGDSTPRSRSDPMPIPTVPATTKQHMGQGIYKKKQKETRGLSQALPHFIFCPSLNYFPGIALKVPKPGMIMPLCITIPIPEVTTYKNPSSSYSSHHSSINQQERCK